MAIGRVAAVYVNAEDGVNGGRENFRQQSVATLGCVQYRVDLSYCTSKPPSAQEAKPPEAASTPDAIE